MQERRLRWWQLRRCAGALFCHLSDEEDDKESREGDYPQQQNGYSRFKYELDHQNLWGNRVEPCFLVAVPVQVLLLRAKDLFVGADYARRPIRLVAYGGGGISLNGVSDMP